MKLQKTKNGQYTVTIPKTIVEGMNLRKGDDVDAVISGPREITLRFKWRE